MTTSLLLIFVALQAPALSPNGIGVITGQILAADGQPASGVSVLVAVGTLKNGKTNLIPIAVSIPDTMAKTDNTGHYRIENVPPGRYFLLAQPITISNGEVATLYPGVTSLNAARKVEVGPDSELSGIDFSIAQSSLVKIRGHVLNAITGAPSKAASVSLTGGVFSSFRT